ncbi:MAG: hypothetical protein KAR20_03485 [Candidatus Heimdallarchaeota archaeon]|nr:hypothetical protein [Candidatus Heimdallarchaeota archaeon]
MTQKIEIKDKDDWMSSIELKDNADFMYFLAQLIPGTKVLVANDAPKLYCKIEIFDTEQREFE